MSISNKKFYFNVIQKDEIEDLFTDFAKIKKKLIVSNGDYFDEQSTDEFEIIEYVHARLELFFIKKKKNLFKKESIKKFNETPFKFKIEDKDKKIDFYSESRIHFNKQEKRYSLKLDSKKIYRAQQRQNYRLESSDKNKISIKLDQEKYNVIDISSSGACIEFSIDTPLSMNLLFNDVILTLKNEQYGIKEVKIVKIWEETQKLKQSVSPWRAGVEFTKLSTAIENKLTKKIHSTARVQEMNKLFKSKNI